MIRYYVFENNDGTIKEINKLEWDLLVGDDITVPYVTQVYNGQITIEDVPEDLRTKVSEIVANRVSRWGEYIESEISSEELQSMIEEVL